MSTHLWRPEGDPRRIGAKPRNDARVDENPRKRGLCSFEEEDHRLGDEYVMPLEA